MIGITQHFIQWKTDESISISLIDRNVQKKLHQSLIHIDKMINNEKFITLLNFKVFWELKKSTGQNKFFTRMGIQVFVRKR